MTKVQNKKPFQNYFLVSLLGGLIGFCVIVIFKAGIDMAWPVLIPLSLRKGASSAADWLKAEELAKVVPRLALAIAKSFSRKPK